MIACALSWTTLAALFMAPAIAEPLTPNQVDGWIAFAYDESPAKPDLAINGLGELPLRFDADTEAVLRIRPSSAYEEFEPRRKGPSEPDWLRFTVQTDGGESHTIGDIMCSYRGFFAFPFDFDADGSDEIVLQHKSGRGTAATDVVLRIYSVHDGEYRESLRMSVASWALREDHKGPPVRWSRRFLIRAAPDGRSHALVIRNSPIPDLSSASQTDALLLRSESEIVTELAPGTGLFEITEVSIN